MPKPGIEMRLTGVTSTVAAFSQLKAGAQRTVARPAVRAGASIVSMEAKANAKPSSFEDSSGALRRSIGVKVRTARSRGRPSGIYALVGARQGQGDRQHTDKRGVTVTRKPFRYDHLVEGGTKPHFAGKGGKQFHPGAEAKPFLGPAFEDNRVQIESAVRTRLAEEIEKNARRVAAKQAAKAVSP